MSESVKVFVVAGMAAVLSACSGHLSEAERAAPPGNAFAATLQSGYVALARAESDESDFADARVFAARALDSARGAPPVPEALSARKLPQESLPALADARVRLVRVLDGGARASSGRDAAEAQIGFDCWMQEQEENFQSDDIAECRGRFDTAMARIEKRTVSMQQPAKRFPATRASLEGTERTVPPLATRFVVYFDLDAAALSPSSEAEIARAANAARRIGAATIRITGHADRAGTEPHNIALSRSRAQAVTAALRRSGLPQIGVATLARGETNPVVKTADGIPEPRNRRVEIELIH